MSETAVYPQEGSSGLSRIIVKLRHSTMYHCGHAMACCAAGMGFARPFGVCGIHRLREVVCNPETKGLITKCWFHVVFYVAPECFL